MSEIFGSENGLGAGIYREVLTKVQSDLLNNPPQLGSATNIVYQPGGAEAPPTTVQKKLREIVSLGDKNASPGGVVNATAAVAAARAESAAVYVPEGRYRADGPIEGLYGPGEIITGGRRVRLPMAPRRDNPISAMLACMPEVSTGGGVLTLIADSIGEGYYTNSMDETWFNMLQKMINVRNANGGEPEVTHMVDPARYGLTYTGAYAAGTAGPIEKSVVMQAGCVMMFTGKYRYVDPVFEQKPGGGVITMARNGVTFRTIDTNGAAVSDKCVFPSDVGGEQTDTDVYTLTVSGAPVEITGLWRLVYANGEAIFCSRAALSASSTTLHSKDARIDSVIRHAKSLNSASTPVFIVALGINNTSGVAGVATDSGTYQAQLEKMFARYISAGARVIALGLIRPTGAWPQQRNGFGEFQAAQARACQTYGVPLIRMDGVDWEGNGLLFDGLHPNSRGNLYMLDKILSDMTAPGFSAGGSRGEFRLNQYLPTLSWLGSGLSAGTIGTANVRWTRNGPFCRVIGNLSNIQPSANPANGSLCIGLPQKSGVMRCSGTVGAVKGLVVSGTTVRPLTMQTTGDGYVAVVRLPNSGATAGEKAYLDIDSITAGAIFDFDIEYLVEG